jgi:MFS family permease
MNQKPALLIFSILLPYALGYFLSYLLRNVNAVIAPDLIQALGLSAADLGLLTSAYLVGFAIAQLPLGIALDRWGPRRVVTGLLFIAALGCVGFALGSSLTQLAIARGLIGLGFSACLMGAFKAFAQAFPVARQAAMNASIMVAGGLGGVTASLPVSFLLPIVGWRSIFFVFAGLIFLAAFFIRQTPEPASARVDTSIKAMARDMGAVFVSRAFWRFAPQTAFLIGGFVSIQGLWAIPWLIGVNGYSPAKASFHLLLLSLALTVGYFLLATQITRLIRQGMTVEGLFSWGAFLSLGLAVLIILDVGPSALLWLSFGFFCASFNLIYASHTSYYPANMTGRANACLNLVVFVGGFAMQWGFGLIVDTAQGQGFSRAQSLQFAWMILLMLQAISFLWFWFSRYWVAAKPLATF